MILAVLVTALQFVACKLFFLTYEESWQNTIIVNNRFTFCLKTNVIVTTVICRRVFNWYAYMVLLYNIAAGLVFSLLRVAGSAIIGLLAMFRMDIILFIKGFECLDLGIYMCALLSSLQVLFTGHNMYSKFILLEDLLNNPVMHVFLGLVSKKIKVHGESNQERLSFDQKRNGTNKIIIVSIQYLFFSLSNAWLLQAVAYPRVSKRAFNRWKVAYTLLRNPSLQQLTASNLPEPAVLVDSKPSANNNIHLDTDGKPLEFDNRFHDSEPNAINPFHDQLQEDVDNYNMKQYFD